MRDVTRSRSELDRLRGELLVAWSALVFDRDLVAKINGRITEVLSALPDAVREQRKVFVVSPQTRAVISARQKARWQRFRETRARELPER
jgi:hypothetical protein